MLRANTNQRDNPVVQQLQQHVAVEFTDDIQSDFSIGNSTRNICILYLSLRYHRLHPDYIYTRMQSITTGDCGACRILLLHVDADSNNSNGQMQHHDSARADVRDIGVRLVKSSHPFTLMLAWSVDECAKYLHLYTQQQQKPATRIKERVDTTDFMARITDILTAIKGVNKTDVMTLISTFGGLRGIVEAGNAELRRCPGIGPTKVKKLAQTFQQPFLTE